MLTADRLREILDYDPETGIFLRDGKIAGTLNGLKYRQMKIEGSLYLVHRLAWLFVYGDWPSRQIDHINGIKDDNRISNLRLATGSENLRNRPKPRNNTSGYKGVSWINHYQKWQATIKFDGKNKFLGRFATREEAAEVYNLAALQHHGEFARLDL